MSSAVRVIPQVKNDGMEKVLAEKQDLASTLVQYVQAMPVRPLNSIVPQPSDEAWNVWRSVSYHPLT